MPQTTSFYRIFARRQHRERVTWTDVTGSGLGGPSWGNEMRMDINGGEVSVQFFQPKVALPVVVGAGLRISPLMKS